MAQNVSPQNRTTPAHARDVSYADRQKAKPHEKPAAADMLYLDAADAIVGRLCSYAAKEALRGKHVVIINSEAAVITGEPDKIVERYYKRRQMTNKNDPNKAPVWPRKENLLLKKIIRGMLPKHSSRGHQAIKRVTAYIGKPEAMKETPKRFTANSDGLKAKFITLKKLCASI